jgi:hypothetical protein
LSRNVFVNLTLAAASIARTGNVRVLENTVRECAAGFWFGAWEENYIELHPEQPTEAGGDLLLLYALVCEETALVLFAPMMLPLPAQIKARTPFEVAPRIALTFSGNDIDCTPAQSSPAAMGASLALATFTDTNPATTSVLVTGNRLMGSAPTIYPMLLTTLAGDLTITGNQVTNRPTKPDAPRPKLSLLISPSSATEKAVTLNLAVTGNLFHGATNLGDWLRPGNLAAPLNNWDTFNAVLSP